MRRSASEPSRDGGSARGGVLLAAAVWLLAASPAGAAEGGLDVFPDAWILGVLVVLFALLVFPLQRLLFRPIFGVLDAREERIAGTRERAAQIAAEADQALARYESSIEQVREESELERRQRLDAARGETAAQMAAARAEAERVIERARREIAGALVEARSALRAEAEGLADAAAAGVLGRVL